MAGQPSIRDNNAVPSLIAVDPSITENQSPNDRGNSIKRLHVLKDPVTIGGQAYNPLIVYDANSTGSGGTEFDDGDAIDTDSQGTLILGATAVPGVAHPVHVDASGDLQVDILTMPTVTISPTFDDGDTVDTDSQGFLIMGATKALPGIARAVTVDASGDLQVDVLTLPITEIDDGDTVTTDTQGRLILGVENGALPQTARAIRLTTSGHVIIADGGNVITVDGSVTVSGADAHDAAVSANPVVIGARGSEAHPTRTDADGDTTRVWSDRSGRFIVVRGSPAVTFVQSATITPGSGTVTLIAAPGSNISIYVHKMTISNEGGAGILTIERDPPIGSNVTQWEHYIPQQSFDPDGQWMTWHKVTSNNALVCFVTNAGLSDAELRIYIEYSTGPG
jgi:hypothetical protein